MNSIVVKNANGNNLKNVSVAIPKNKITVFTGVSGSGKSSLVFETIGAEAQRELNDTYDSYIRNRLPQMPRPEVESISNLNVAIIINQKKIGGNARSTLGTATDIYALLRLLFSRFGKPFIGYSSRFSFNNPQGMCPRCEGLGKISDIDTAKLFDREKSLNEGAILFPTFTPGSYRWLRYVRSGYFDNDKKLEEYSDSEWDMLLHAAPHKPQHPANDWGKTVLYEGVLPRIRRGFLKKESKELARYSSDINRVVVRQVCPACNGARLNEDVLTCRIKGKNIADCSAMQIDQLRDFIAGISDRNMQGVVRLLISKLGHLQDVGLSYLSLDRETSTLSGGESQRIKMVKHLGSSLTNLVYIFDEPSTGLHPADVDRLNRQMKQLRDKGNTILIVEHDPDVIAIADHIIDMGPGAGRLGGKIVFDGSLNGLRRSKGQTGQYFRQERKLNTQPVAATGYVEISHANDHNLKNVSVRIATGILTVVTGVAGSGKSSLINHALSRQLPALRVIDQQPLRGSRRSHLASYSGIFDEIRTLFAAANQVSPALFSRNSEGACPECKGLGKQVLDLAFMDDVVETCEVCQGSGYKDAVLGYQYKGRNIAEVMEMDVSEALAFFKEQPMAAVLRKLEHTGLGYMSLGQSLDTFSGGERQRLKLAIEMDQDSGFFVFDEPTTGLHPADIDKLMIIFRELIDRGNSVLLIEHNLDVIRQADWIIDMGPGAGTLGGEIVFEGTPEELCKHEGSLTGRHLRRFVQAAY
ncbi:daunorubicin resistance protein DrrC [Pedobacter yulinensis]|uniref:UvrABC system protein A n=1 Tax=Pedobacter yulinensis TaxID=2126353 RepID=A0A2T3HLZ2_9SPHI|nr:excinuclease ABC subunit UvrA [Pedobacter yulinensis]PST83478.1 daunorubicin resistance protein DrrC [Pedobacter yulinensis]